jgi:uncharacterized protein (DUF697 family)
MLIVSEKQATAALSERERKAAKTVRNYMVLSMGAGLIPFPVADLAAISGVQLKMLADISKIYGVPFKESSGKAIIASLVGSLVPQAVSFGAIGSMLKSIPGVGILIGAPSMMIFSAATAWALGNVFIQHFESGGTFLDFNPDSVREYFRKQYAEGRQKAAAAGAKEETAEAPV